MFTVMWRYLHIIDFHIKLNWTGVNVSLEERVTILHLKMTDSNLQRLQFVFVVL